MKGSRSRRISSCFWPPLWVALAVLPAAPLEAQSMPVAVREGELAASVGLPLEIDVVYAFRALPVPLTLGVSVLPLALGGSLSIGARPVLARFSEHQLILVGSIGGLALDRDGLSIGGRGDLWLQLVFTCARVTNLDILVSVAPGVDAAVVSGALEGWRVRASLSSGLGLSWTYGALWLEGELGTTIDGVGAPTLRAEGRLVGSIRP